MHCLDIWLLFYPPWHSGHRCIVQILSSKNPTLQNILSIYYEPSYFRSLPKEVVLVFTKNVPSQQETLMQLLHQPPGSSGRNTRHDNGQPGRSSNTAKAINSLPLGGPSLLSLLPQHHKDNPKPVTGWRAPTIPVRCKFRPLFAGPLDKEELEEFLDCHLEWKADPRGTPPASIPVPWHLSTTWRARSTRWSSSSNSASGCFRAKKTGTSSISPRTWSRPSFGFAVRCSDSSCSRSSSISPGTILRMKTTSLTGKSDYGHRSFSGPNIRRLKWRNANASIMFSSSPSGAILKVKSCGPVWTTIPSSVGDFHSCELRRRWRPLYEVRMSYSCRFLNRALRGFSIVDFCDDNKFLYQFTCAFELRRHRMRYGIGHTFARPIRERLRRRWKPSL